jgi:hypothetical protein
LVVAGLELVYGIRYLTEGGARAVVVVSNWAWAALFAGFAVLLWRRCGLRWTGITVCVWLAAVGLAAGIYFLTKSFPQGVGPAWAVAGLFAVLAVLLWRRGRQHAAVGDSRRTE